MKKNNYYRGIRGIIFLWHGSTADPELSYKGMTVNYYDVEDTIWKEYIEDIYTRSLEDPDDEEEFTDYCQRHAAEIKQLIVDIWNQSRN
jgi:6-pyruvoyl-tetrahydropterin synthase